ncbi:glycosyltransferase [Devosia submarina]|uniref:glycosyltransferase n=1 Tax=Devosia submarina TaxID=1173082 RepID=UPI001300AD7D|nr:glycosyltransferase [Devosia submarina]
MNILFATTSLPHARSTGAEIASQAFIDAMRMAGHKVHVLGFARDSSPPPPGSTAAEIRAIETASAGWAKFGWLVGSLLRHQPYVCEKFRSQRYVDLLDQLAGDLLVIDHTQMCWLLPQWQRWAKSLVFIAHNHEAALYATQAKRVRNMPQAMLLTRDSHLLRTLETQLAQAANQIWTLSEAERSAFEAMGGHGKTSLMPLAGQPLLPATRRAEKLFDIGLLGTWSWDVNGRGLEWFVRKVLPLLPAHVSVRIAGRGSEHLPGATPNCIGLGFVPDAAGFVASARVLAIPTITGAGIQLKTIEAIASGTPTVSTSLGLRGLTDLPGYVAAADTPEQFATALMLQLHTGRQDGTAGRSWAQKRQEAFERHVATALAKLEGWSNTAEVAVS